MPSLKKTLHFLSSALATSVSVGLLGFSMSTQWAVTAMDCSTDGTVYSNGTAVITVELFSGNVVRNSCPFFGGLEHFQGNFLRLSKVHFTKLRNIFSLAYL